MKRFTTGLLITCLSLLLIHEAKGQQPVKNYEEQWKKVSDFVKKKLPKSALTEVKAIYTLAKKENQDAQVIKSLLYISRLQQERREDNEAFSIEEIEKEKATSKEPVTSVLNNMLANIYWNYFQNIRWQLYNRTETVNFDKEDIATWSVEDFHKKIGELYLASLRNEKLLQETKLEPYDAIIAKGNTRKLRPTLFDLLAHDALDYFKNDERNINKPAYAFEIGEAAAFAPVADFVNHRFVTRDSLSLHYKALLIYQKLLAFHLNDKTPDALVDADINRIEFIKNNSTHPDKDQLYFDAINHIAQQYENLPAATQAWYLVANYYEEKALSYKPYGDSTHQYDRVKAKEICGKVLQQYDISKIAEEDLEMEGVVNCYNLLNRINAPTLGFVLEKVNIPGQPFRALITYQNFSQLYLRIIQPDEKLKEKLANQYDNDYWSSLVAANPIREWQQALPVTTDLQKHRTEIKIDALSPGEYILLAGSDKNFKKEETVTGARFFYVSHISFVNKDDDYFVLNRDNGSPLDNALVQVWENKYDYKKSKYILEKTGSYTTNENGFFHLQHVEGNDRRYNYSYRLEISHNADHLFMDEAISNYYYSNNIIPDPKTDTSVFLFTDRSIYRPGQAAYFKGIVLSKNSAEKKAGILNSYATMIYLVDANGQQVDSLSAETNEFGSFSGKFQLPSFGLNGSFSIQTRKNYGYAGFMVEEYKRPKFYVDYEPIRGTYQVNDTIKITGSAKAYAGNNIDGATVKYRVVRQPRFIYPWLFRRWWLPSTSPMEITHGEIKTNDDGKFTIEFTAIPDLKIEKKFDPVFDYTVYADITDINGETRSGEQSVTAGYKSLLLKTDIPGKLEVDSLRALFVRTENMNGEFEPAVIHVTITKLKEEKRLIRERFWERPDQFSMTKENYISYFPHDEYDNESDYTSWEKGEKIFERSDSTKESGKWKVENGKFEAGFYIIEIVTKDKNGESVKDISYIELYNQQSRQLSHPEYLWTQGSDPIEPGESTSVKLGTAADNLFVVQTIDRSHDSRLSSPTYSYLRLSNEKKTIPFSATEADRGGYGASWVFVKHNRVYQFNETIAVPWTNKELSVEYATYRDKTLPGSEEKWKVKITGYKKEKVAAEMLTSMYDASLDQFYPHSWIKPGIWSNYYNIKSWNGNNNFQQVNAVMKYTASPASKYVTKIYDELLTSSYYYPGMDEVVVVGYGGKGRRNRRNEEIMLMRAPSIEVLGNADMKITSGINAFSASITDTNDPSKIIEPSSEKEDQFPEIQTRKNFNETAFFFPDLRTDADGAIEFSFTMPEALTKWKFQALAHTKDLAFGYSSKEIITQKQLMVQPNPPRFLREGDKMELSAKVVNISDKELTGQAFLQLFDATTNEPLDGRFKNIIPNQYFTIAAGQSEAIKFPVEIPYQFNKALVWKIMASAESFSDGEENVLPVLTNRMLVTETMPIHMRGAGTKNFQFDKLLNSGASETLRNHALTVEYTSNPAWYAVQALPYLMEYPYDCAEQTWNRYYANSLATMIANTSPRIRQIFEEWKTKDTAALLSNLQKNEELKSILLEETPWLLQAKNENEQKKNIALLFDMMRMSNELNGSFEKLKQMQSDNGGFVWFKGGPDDQYITQYIITGIGHLRQLHAVAAGQQEKLQQILDIAIPYLDKKIREDYNELRKSKTDMKKYVPGYYEIQYLYMRSFFPGYPVPGDARKAYNYFIDRATKTWTRQNKYMQGMIALTLYRADDKKTPAAILNSLKETSISNEELGMYWKDLSRSWWWYEAPIERQALLIEAFSEISKDSKTVDDLRTWLLKNKQTNNWNTTKATAEACYALLLQGTEWLTSEPEVEINLGPAIVKNTADKEAGTGYIKHRIDGELIKPAMGNITVSLKNPVSPSTDQPGNSSSWGAVYWQYFEDLDKITTAETPLKLSKKLFIEKNTDRGPVLDPVNEGDILHVGDKIKVRIELRADRDMEYVHMKDMRASAMEPVNVLSSYKWQDGLGYYESTRDASTNFFFGQLRKGTYVFEYPLFITHTGNFSNGVTTIECMYAPEFSSHSEGIRINVE